MIDKFLTRMSPLTLLATGLIAGAAASPVIQKGLRGLAVSTVKLGLAVSDQVKSGTGKLSAGYNGIVNEARTKRESGSGVNLPAVVSDKLHATGVAAVKGGMAVTDQVKGISSGLQQKWSNLVEEAGKDTGSQPEAGEEQVKVDLGTDQVEEAEVQAENCEDESEQPKN